MKFKSLSTALALAFALAVVALGQTPQAAKPEANPAKKEAAPKLAISKTQFDFEASTDLAYDFQSRF